MARLKLDRSGPWIGVVGVLVNLWLTLSSLRYAPWWFVLLLLSFLIPQAILIARWAPVRPRYCIMVPIVGAAMWMLVVITGAQLGAFKPR